MSQHLFSQIGKEQIDAPQSPLYTCHEKELNILLNLDGFNTFKMLIELMQREFREQFQCMISLYKNERTQNDVEDPIPSLDTGIYGDPNADEVGELPPPYRA